MTQEEIAAYWARGSNCDCYAKELVTRLLEERKRLLAGLREAMEFLELEGDHGEAAWLALKEARAFAEEPAR